MEDYPAVDVAAPAREALDLVTTAGRAAVLVLRGGRPCAVLPASQLLRAMVPAYLREDPSLVRTLDERGADATLLGRLAGRTVGDLLGEAALSLPHVRPSATLLECATEMAAAHSPLCAVLDEDGVLVGAVTTARVLAAMAA